MRRPREVPTTMPWVGRVGSLDSTTWACGFLKITLFHIHCRELAVTYESLQAGKDGEDRVASIIETAAAQIPLLPFLLFTPK